MLLAVDIGNSNIKFGIFDGDNLVSRSSIATADVVAAGAIPPSLVSDLDTAVTAAVVCSVVSEADHPVIEFLTRLVSTPPLVVSHEQDLGLKVDYSPPSSLGVDRLVNCFGAAEKYGVPSIVCSFGTAATIDLVGPGREISGGVIAPGLRLMAKALHQNTSRLPDVDITVSGPVLGKTTNGSIRSGVYYGYLSMVEGLIKRVIDAAGVTPIVVATGGDAALVAANISVINVVDPDLLLDALRLIYDRTYQA